MKRSKFNLSYYRLQTQNMGSLYPVGLCEVLPGDTIQHATSALIRCSPLLAPVFHPISVRLHHWFVPNRLIWDGWEDFITGGPDGNDASVPPYFDRAWVFKGLDDYLGLPPLVTGTQFSALPHRAYALIWNEFYRDQDLQAPMVFSKAGGRDITTDITLQQCGWEKDYFTSARPWEQKGPTVTLPLGDTAPVLGIGTGTGVTFTNQNITVHESDGVSRPYFRSMGPAADSPNAENQLYIEENVADTNFPNVRADLSNASAITVNLLREALALQRYEEARARYGSRYTEYLRYLGVRSSDARLQRPEYLGGGKQTIQFSEVLQTGVDPAATDPSPVGALKGHGIASARSNRYRRFFEEHGLVLTFMSVRPKTIYADGMDKLWLRKTKEDFYQKEFEHIGQQEVLNQEVYNGGSTAATGVFGYQDRYDEYRRNWSGIAGEFRTTLDFWHLARMFASKPALNADFVKCVPTERVFAVQSEDTLWCMVKHSMQARRILAAKGTSFTF